MGARWGVSRARDVGRPGAGKLVGSEVGDVEFDFDSDWGERRSQLGDLYLRGVVGWDGRAVWLGLPLGVGRSRHGMVDVGGEKRERGGWVGGAALYGCVVG
jgi:hypothetical protein